ncbi:MAG: hypothetical protein QXG00_02460 [Candidatus Woesearchaeota archaeon]
MQKSKAISIGILIFLLLVIIIYVIVMFEMYKYQKFIFAPYTPPTPPSKFFYPLGIVTPMTQEEIDIRNKVIKASLNIN